MKFLRVFSAVFCALTLGVRAAPALESRAATDTAEYNKVIAVHPSMVPGKMYVFTITWPLGTAGNDKKLWELQQQLGFNHIGLLVGEVMKTEKGPPNKKTIHHDFAGMVYDLRGVKDVSVQPAVYKASSLQLKFVKETKRSQSQIKTAGMFFIGFHINIPKWSSNHDEYC